MGVYLLIIASVSIKQFLSNQWTFLFFQFFKFLLYLKVDAYYRGVYFIYDNEWRSSHLCQFSGFLSTLSSELSVFILTYITIDRYLAIVFPLRLKRDFKQTVIIILIIWLVCFLIASIPLFKFGNYFDHFYGEF